jgi:hypothetical protein
MIVGEVRSKETLQPDVLPAAECASIQAEYVLSICENISILVPGERWEAALVARTQCSLLACGLTSTRYEYRYGDHAEPRTYEDAVAALLGAESQQTSLVIPAGFIVDHQFAELLKGRSLDRLGELVPEGRVPFAVFQPGSRRTVLPEELLQVMVDSGVDRQEGRTEKADVAGRHTRKQEGSDLFQRLGAIDSVRRCELPVRTISTEELSSLRDGWVYRCNNEPIELDLTDAGDCQTLVVVGAGMKPWWIANALRRTLKHVIVVDSHRPQLAFAFQSMQAMGKAADWSAICEGLPFRSIDDRALRPLHDRFYRSLSKTRDEWDFTVHFLAGDLQSQTFGVLEVLQRLSVGRICLWYSNVFRPYTGAGRSEHHAGVEYSFHRLIESRMPGAVCFSTGVRPVRDPRSERLDPDVRFRVRRAFDALAARWLGHR